MEKITKSTDTVLIDPNEPLILPDGTALVGRIEWFLYALCCLDYQNLPTPMSRIEEFANALITGEIPNIEPQSRAEQFFLAILDGNVSNLPQPQSRSEVLLDKLARGEFDLSDVEPIQSRYELLLAYLIKNGGIGNIDYVLYEFSEAMKTMYNTVEKPFKSLELSGNTLVNCVLEDTENDDYTSFDKDYSGTSFTINGTSEGAIKSAILKGNTLVNLMSENERFSASLDGTNPSFWVYKYFTLNQNLKPNTNYTLIFNANISQSHLIHIGGKTGNAFNSTSLSNVVNGVNKFLITTYSDIADKEMNKLFIQSNNSNVVEITLNDFILIEGDHTNEDIPYFTGMQSVKMPVLTTTNGSANILIGSQLNDMTGEIETSPYGNKMIEDYILIPNADITMSSAQWLKVFFYDENKVYISNTGGGYIDSYVLNSSTIPTNAKYFRYHYSGSSYPVIKFSDGTDYITPTVGSEPYKTNILTTTGKNLFDMNRPYDAITDSQATVVQDTNKITVSSAESGTYVSANFILDKDFFAGKTVTGSCLYESDIKDIGTVQIHYQDGNGDHHYQWIRTPKTFTFPNSFIGDVMLCVCVNNTDTPQSNTVTVKNIQLELGSTATSYEPYSEVVLRGIGNVQDTLDCLTGEVTERIGEVVLDGSEEWNLGNQGDGTTTITFTTPILNAKSNVNIISDLFNYNQNSTNGIEGVAIGLNVVFIQIARNKLTSLDSDGVKKWLQQNPITLQYQLVKESIKTVDLNVVDQNNTEIDKIHVFNETTHVNASSDELTPTVNIGKSVSYPTIIKPNTKYTVNLKRNDKPLTVNLGGTEVTFASGETRKTITTPSTLANDKLSYYGIGAKCNEIMLIEGEVEGNVDYFTGMQSVVMQNQMPILSTVGKNKWNTTEMNIKFDSGLKNIQYLDNSIKITNDYQGWRGFTFKNEQSLTHLSFNVSVSKVNDTTKYIRVASDGVQVGRYDLTNGRINVQLPQNSEEIKVQVLSENGVDVDFEFTDIQLEKDSFTSYEPYKTSILSCNEDVTLCGIGNVKDELDCKTGEVTQRVGKLVLDGSSDEDWRISFGGSDTHTRFIMRRGSNLKPINNVNNQRFLCDKFKCVILISGENSDEVCLMESLDNFFVSIIIDNTRLNSVDVDGFKLWLQSNPIVVQYQLATPTIKTVDLFVVDQDGNTIPKVKSHNGTTHLEVTVPKQSLLPNISAEVATDNSKDMSSLTTKHQEISEAQSAIQNSIQSQSNEIDTAMMATTEIFESILE